MNYELLLRKYMKHIVEEEGTDFVEPVELLPDSFTDKEKSELCRISGELE